MKKIRDLDSAKAWIDRYIQPTTGATTSPTQLAEDIRSLANVLAVVLAELKAMKEGQANSAASPS